MKRVGVPLGKVASAILRALGAGVPAGVNAHRGHRCGHRAACLIEPTRARGIVVVQQTVQIASCALSGACGVVVGKDNLSLSLDVMKCTRRTLSHHEAMVTAIY
jgi:hypothetical protein